MHAGDDMYDLLTNALNVRICEINSLIVMLEANIATILKTHSTLVCVVPKHI